MATEAHVALKGEGLSDLELARLDTSSDLPLMWNRRLRFLKNWRRFQPIVLCSKNGPRAIIQPCDSEWWNERVKNGDTSPGYMIRLHDGEYIIEGYSSRQNSRQGGAPAPFRTITIIRKADGYVIAEFDELSSVTFFDGLNYEIIVRKGIPFKRRTQYEFRNQNHASQFHIDDDCNIWIDDMTSPDRTLFLIVASRYIEEIRSLEGSLST